MKILFSTVLIIEPATSFDSLARKSQSVIIKKLRKVFKLMLANQISGNGPMRERAHLKTDLKIIVPIMKILNRIFISKHLVTIDHVVL